MFNIMIIDDNEQLQNELGNMLFNNGYLVTKIKEFNNISSQVENNNPDLILLDINLPNEDGFKICTQIRSFSKVPIIFITSRDTNVDELMGITLGGIVGVFIAVYIVKSLPLDVLKWLVVVVILYTSFTMMKAATKKELKDIS